MTNILPYQYTIDQCDVQGASKETLKVFRDKRAQWLTWLDYDEQHAISSVISTMAWNDVSFRTLAKAGELEPNGCLSNSLLAEALINGHFATQTLAIRRLIDHRNDVISLVRLLRDISENIYLFTRENFVGFDGLSYDYEAAQQQVIAAHIGKGPFWSERAGPNAYWVSEAAHREFDRLSGTASDKRTRTDSIPKSYIDSLQQWITDSGAKDIVDWTHKYLAHAADQASRSLVDTAAIQPNLNKITEILRIFVRVSEAVHALFLSAHGDTMPVAQFNQFEHLNAPLLTDAHLAEVRVRWDELTDERNEFSKNVLDDLLGPPVTAQAEQGPSIQEVLHDPEWLADPEGKCDREIERCLQEFREKS